jgi:hypothetical protein
MIDAVAATDELAGAFAACDKSVYDIRLNHIADCLQIIGTRRARRLARRSLVEKLTFQRRWLKWSDSRDVERFAVDYDGRD